MLPTPQFFYGMETGEEIAVELEPGKSLVVKFLTVSEPHPDGTRTVFFELNGQPREVTVRDQALQATVPARRQGRSGESGRSGRADSGRGLQHRGGRRPAGEEGRPAAGDGSDEDAIHRLCAGDGKVTQKLANVGDKVDAKDLLLVIE